MILKPLVLTSLRVLNSVLDWDSSVYKPLGMMDSFIVKINACRGKRINDNIRPLLF